MDNFLIESYMTEQVSPSPEVISRRDIKVEATKPDNVIVTRSALDVGPLIVFFVLSLFFMIYASRVFEWSVQPLSLFKIFGAQISLSIPLFGLIPLVLLGKIIHSLMNYKYIICPDYILEVSGICDFTLKTTRLHYHHIKTIDLDKRFYQRFFDLGDLILATDITRGDSEIVMRGIPEPRRYKDIIEGKIQSKLKELSARITTNG